MQEFAKIPELLRGLLDHLAQQKVSSSQFREEAKQKLIKDLQGIMGDMAKKSTPEEEKNAEEQIKQIVSQVQAVGLNSLIQKIK